MPVHVDLRGIRPGGGLYENKQEDKRRLVFREAVRFSGGGGEEENNHYPRRHGHQVLNERCPEVGLAG